MSRIMKGLRTEDYTGIESGPGTGPFTGENTREDSKIDETIWDELPDDVKDYFVDRPKSHEVNVKQDIPKYVKAIKKIVIYSIDQELKQNLGTIENLIPKIWKNNIRNGIHDYRSYGSRTLVNYFTNRNNVTPQSHRLAYLVNEVLRIVIEEGIPYDGKLYDIYGNIITPPPKDRWLDEDDIKEDKKRSKKTLEDYTGIESGPSTGSFAGEKTPEENPYGGKKSRKFRGAVSEGDVIQGPWGKNPSERDPNAAQFKIAKRIVKLLADHNKKELKIDGFGVNRETGNIHIGVFEPKTGKTFNLVISPDGKSVRHDHESDDLLETPNQSPVGDQPGGWREYHAEPAGLKEELDENLHQWFKEKWVRFGPDGKIKGACARGSSKEGKPKCLPQKKAQALGKKGRKYAAAKKRREDPNPNRRGPAHNVVTKKKKTSEGLDSVKKNKCPKCGGPIFEASLMNEKKDACYYKVKSRYKVWPSAYASGALVKCRKKGAKNWGTKSENVKEAANLAQQAAIAINMEKQHKKPKARTESAKHHAVAAQQDAMVRALTKHEKIDEFLNTSGNGGDDSDHNFPRKPQQFKKGDIVWISNPRGQKAARSHFAHECPAIIMYSYEEKYGRSNGESYVDIDWDDPDMTPDDRKYWIKRAKEQANAEHKYAVTAMEKFKWRGKEHVRINESAWYPDSVLTLIPRNTPIEQVFNKGRSAPYSSLKGRVKKMVDKYFGGGTPPNKLSESAKSVDKLRMQISDRILTAHDDLFDDYGYDKVARAIDHVAKEYGDNEDQTITDSDITLFTKKVADMVINKLKQSKVMDEGEVIPADFSNKELANTLPTKADLLYNLTKKKLSKLTKRNTSEPRTLRVEIAHLINELMHDNPDLEPNPNDLGLSPGKKTLYDVADVFIDRMKKDGSFKTLGYDLSEKVNESTRERWDADMMYRVDTSRDRLQEKSILQKDARDAMANGWRYEIWQALRDAGIIRSKFDPKKYVKRGPNGKWVEVFPYGEPKVDEARLNPKLVKVDHNKVYHMINALAIACIKGRGWDEHAKAFAKMEAENDAFWSSYVDEVTSALESHLNDKHRMDYNGPIEALQMAVENVAENIVEYFENPMNFGPGGGALKKGSLIVDTSKLTDQVMLKAIKKVTGRDITKEGASIFSGGSAGQSYHKYKAKPAGLNELDTWNNAEHYTAKPAGIKRESSVVKGLRK